jgi:hypothetical protein
MLFRAMRRSSAVFSSSVVADLVYFVLSAFQLMPAQPAAWTQFVKLSF